MEKILLFIPCYNCEKQIGRVLKQLDEEMMSYISEVIVVNNRSTDQTEQQVLAFIQEHPELPVHLLRNDQNYNLGGSHKVAFRYAVKNEFDYLIVLHGDDQGDVHDTLSLLKNQTYKNYDCCLGARFMKGSTLLGYSKFRILGNKVFNTIFSISTGQKVTDMGSGLNMYKVDMLKDPFYIRFSDSLVFNNTMIFANAYYHFNVHFFPISWRETDQVSNAKMVSQSLRLLKLALGYMFSNKQKFITQEFRDNPISEYTAQEVSQ